MAITLERTIVVATAVAIIVVITMTVSIVKTRKAKITTLEKR